MKLVIFILASALTISAQVASGISNEVQPLQMSGHPATASIVILQAGGSYAVATGEQPIWQFPTGVIQEPLGDVARRYRAEKENAPKSKIRLEK